MQVAPSSGTAEKESVADPSPRTSRLNKFLVASAATMGVGAMAISPVVPTPTPPALHEAQVALTAAADPLVLLQNFFTETLVNSGYLQVNATNASEALGEAFIDQDVAGQLANVFLASASDPEATLAAFIAYQTLSSEAIQKALFAPDNPATPRVDGGVFTNLGPELENFFNNVLPDMMAYDTPTQGTTPGYQPRNGDEVPGVFTQPLFEFNYWFVENFLRVVQPLTPVNDLGSQFVASLPGGSATQLPALLGAVSEGGAIRALIGPAQTTAFQFTAVLDSVYEAVETGDNEVVAAELASLPVKLANAFVNGFTPEFSLCTNAAGCQPRALEWPSQLDPGSQGGLVRYLLVDFPNSVTRILTDPDGSGPLLGTSPPPVVPTDPVVPPATLPSTSNNALQKVSSTAIPTAGNTVTLPTGDGTKNTTTGTTKGTGSDRQTNVVSRISDQIQGNIAKATSGLTGGKHAADNGSGATSADRVTVRDLVSRLGVGKKPTSTSTDASASEKDAEKSESAPAGS